VSGAIVAGVGGGMLISSLGVIGGWRYESPGSASFIWRLLVLTVLACFAGNAIARYPYEVVIEKGKGLRVHASFKKLYIPMQDLRDVRFSGEGPEVRLQRGHRILGILWEPDATAGERDPG
jgi:hypothetical protein